MMDAVTLRPGEWVRLPGSATMVRWDGEQAVLIYARAGGYWDLSPLSTHGRVMLWACVSDRPELGKWPIVPLARRVTYRSSSHVA